MKNSVLLVFLVCLLAVLNVHAQLPVVNSHPRILLDSAAKARLLAKKTANDPDWQALKTEADNYAARQVLGWNATNATVWNTAYIFYSYCGSSWDDAAMSLGMAHQLTKGNAVGSQPDAYSAKLLQLTDTILAAYAAFPACNGCTNILQYNSSYATRHVGNALGITFDWCYDELGATRKAAMISMFNNWFNYMRVPYNVYQNTVHPTGNYYFGHVLCAAYLGYASANENAMAPQMIDFARQRVLGTQSGSLAPADLTTHWVKQTYLHSIPTTASGSYLGPANYVTAPQKYGIPVQGWGYGGGSMKRLIDYCMMVRSATGEAIADSMRPYFDATVTGFVHSLTPNRFQQDPSNDWGSFLGTILGYGLPLRLAAVTEGTAMGPTAEYVSTQWVQPVVISQAWNHGYLSLNWENMLYKNPARPATAFSIDPFYPAPTNNVMVGVSINEAIAKYYVRENWSDTATWCALNMSCAYYDDHDHHNAGHFQLMRGDNHDGDDLLLVGANEIGNEGVFGTNGITGGTCYHFSSSLSNTLFFDDFHVYTPVNTSGHVVGGQSFYGSDEPTHQEQNIDFSYIRADLSSAYNRKGELADTVNRTLRYFYRSFFYLRDMDVVLSYDKFAAKNSTNPSGQYLKHLRWHFLEQPTIAGSNITAIEDNSKLFLHTVIPASVAIATVNESNNPDNTFGPGLNYAFNTYSWRAEVSTTGNPLRQDMLTVLQPSSLTGTEMVTSAIATTTSDMEGTVVNLYGKQELVLFNLATAARPTPINATTYAFPWHLATMHSLVGMTPGAKYQVDYDGTSVSVAASPSGNEIASVSGVLRFAVSLPIGIQNMGSVAVHVYPNPVSINGLVHCNWENADFSTVDICAVTGQLLDSYPLIQGQRDVQMRMPSAGIYYVTLCSSSGKSVTRKVVVTQ